MEVHAHPMCPAQRALHVAQARLCQAPRLQVSSVALDLQPIECSPLNTDTYFTRLQSVRH